MGYYAGDPGFFSIIKSVGSGLASFIPGVGGTVSKAISMIPAGVRTMGAKAVSTAVKHPVISAAGAAGALAVSSGTAGRMGAFGRPVGKHPSKRHLHALAMGLKRARPRMNPCNVHALRRAARRAHAFIRISQRIVGHFHAKKPKGRPYIKKAKKK